jgi:prefoldin subunit 5
LRQLQNFAATQQFSTNTKRQQDQCTMAESEPDAAEIQQKIEQYSSFVDKTLRPDLDQTSKAVKETEQEIQEYQELRTQLQEMQQSSDAGKQLEPFLVDLGHKKAFCQATANDTTTAFVHVGMGFHAELLVPEALVFVEKRIRFLEEQVLSRRVSRTKQVEQHILSSETILDQLVHELKKTHIN